MALRNLTVCIDRDSVRPTIAVAMTAIALSPYAITSFHFFPGLYEARLPEHDHKFREGDPVSGAFD